MIDIVFFGSLREKVGCDTLQLELDQPASVQSVIDTLLAQSDQFQPLSTGRTLCAINQEMSDFKARVQAGDELAFFPPVTGG